MLDAESVLTQRPADELVRLLASGVKGLINRSLGRGKKLAPGAAEYEQDLVGQDVRETLRDLEQAYWRNRGEGDATLDRFGLAAGDLPPGTSSDK